MELNQLIYFQKVARSGSVTKAAQELFIAQPTLSQSLSRLEDSIGVPLFDRQPGKRLKLSPAGELFLRNVDKILLEMESAVNQVRELDRNESTHVSIASSIHDLCSDLILEYFHITPGVHISQRMVDIEALTSMLLNDEVDFAISPCPLTDPRLDCVPLCIEELLVVVGPGHRLYGRSVVIRDELWGEHFICNYSESDRHYLERLFQGSGQDIDIIFESNEPNIIRSLVETGIGVAFRPARLVMRRQHQDQRPEVNCAIRIVGHQFDTPTCISRKKNRSLLRSSQDFYEYAVKFCQQESERVAEYLEATYPLNQK